MVVFGCILLIGFESIHLNVLSEFFLMYFDLWPFGWTQKIGVAGYV